MREVRDGGRRCLIGYVMGGVRADWTDLMRAMVDGGADVIEIGVPFSDPMLDGPVIQRACRSALGRGVSLERILDDLPEVAAPVVAMTYTNQLVSRGFSTYMRALSRSGVCGSLVADLPFAESAEYLSVARDSDVAPVLMVAPSTPLEAAVQIAGASEGFVYSMSAMAPTGSEGAGGDAGRQAAQRLRSRVDVPVVVGFGIDSPERAARAVRHSDGVVVASALMQRVLDGASAATIAGTVAEFRRRIDSAA
nr:tryptophan synthase subunit alpha [Nocardia bovistercoris]